MPGSVACFGAAHLDRHARADRPVVLASSNPVAVSTALGGVARNVAESLARLGRQVALVSRVGSDSDGDRVVGAMTGHGVDMAATGRSAARPTAGYTALVGPDGELVVALADMAVYDEITPAVLETALAGIRRHGLWFADCNLPADSIRFLRGARPSGTILAVDTVSVAKAGRLESGLEGIDLLFCNRDEAAAMAGGGGDADDAARAAEVLRSRGADAVVVSLGAEGIVVAGPGGGRREAPVAADIRDVTGAGDALVAGTLFGLTGGQPLLRSVRIGLAAAAMAVESDRAVSPDLSADALLARSGVAV